MNRIELVALFTSLDTHCENNDLASIKRIVKAVLDEARTEKGKKKDKEDSAPWEE